MYKIELLNIDKKKKCLHKKRDEYQFLKFFYLPSTFIHVYFSVSNKFNKLNKIPIQFYLLFIIGFKFILSLFYIIYYD